MTTRRRIYLDHAATSPVDPAVSAEMMRHLGADGTFANPSSSHAMGREAARAVERARRVIAARIGADPAGLVFTSGATEANNLAIKGVLAAARPGRRHLVTTRIEHKSVLDAAAAVERYGCDVTYVGCDGSGLVSPDEIERAIRPETSLVSVMHVNNETGMVQPIAAVAEICRAHRVPLHVDAAQSAGKLLLDVRRDGVALCSLTAHKCGGPKGIGALWIRDDVTVVPLLHGGEQQRGLRPGTLPTHQIAGMGKAFELADPAEEGPRLAALRDRLREALERIDGARVNGDPARAAPHILNVAFPGVDGEALRFALREIAVSAGSACMSDNPEASHVLSAMGLTDAAATSSIRFSVGRTTTADEIDAAATRVRDAVERLRRLALGAPAWCSAWRSARLTDDPVFG
ncbi:MAG TPA: cysteine desulfurase family protein [Gammaproteobacteria bacterium]